MQQWHVMYTKPHKESQVNEHIEASGLETFFPYEEIERGHRRGTRMDSFFPQYLFFRADLNTNEANGLRWVPGVRSIVHCENVPLVVDERVIAALRERLAPKSSRHDHAHSFHRGQRLLVEGGPFDGFEAIFQQGLTGRDRAQVMLQLLGAWTRAELTYDQLRPQDQVATPVP